MLAFFNSQFWSYILLPITLISCVILGVKFGFFKFSKIFKIIKTAFSKNEKSSGVSPFGALCIALSGTMGVGNIAGVGVAIALGGAGSIFWLVVCAFLCLPLKFAEVSLASHYKTCKKDGFRGGLMYVIENAFPKFRPLGIFFCVLLIISSVGTGGISQSGSAGVMLDGAFGLPKIVTGVMLGGVCFVLMCSKTAKLSKFSSVFVPALSAVFIIGCVAVIFANFAKLPDALREIFDYAFDFDATFGGLSGFTVSSAVRYGLSRGIFTNETGMGTAPIVHSEANSTPEKQGAMGVVEVIFDTVIMCPIVALAIITSGVHRTCEISPINFTAEAFGSVFGAMGESFVALATLLFAVGAVVGWGFYGKRAVEYLCKSKSATYVYAVVFCTLTALGATIPELDIFNLADIFNGLMMLPNIAVAMTLKKRATEIARKIN